MAAKTKRRPTKKKKLVPGIDHCIQPGCKRDVDSHGNCDTHYRPLLRSVNAGETTWPDLVTQGLAMPPQKVGRKVGPLRAAARATAKKSPKRK